VAAGDAPRERRCCTRAHDHPRPAAYFERLTERPSFARVIAEARPYFGMFPLKDSIPARFLDVTPSN